jgi:type IX secretion system PorP/SprF family membrane protein
MKRIFTICTAALLVFVGLSVQAQQDPQFSMNMYNRLYTNPGYAGSNGGICATAILREQWSGFDGNPQTGVLTVESEVKAIHGGVGLSVTLDRLGAESTIAAKLAYAFRLDLGPGTLGIGIEAGIISRSLDGSKLIAIDESDPTVPTGSTSGLVPDFGFGLYYHTDKLYFGVSSSHLSQGDFSLETPGGSKIYNVARHYYAMAGYNYDITPTLQLRPSLFLKSDAASTQFDVNLTLMYNQLVFAGVSYRVDDAVIAMAGVHWNGFKLGYSYDITTSQLNNYSNGSHEIMLGYCYKWPTPSINQQYRNVRFL